MHASIGWTSFVFLIFVFQFSCFVNMEFWILCLNFFHLVKKMLLISNVTIKHLLYLMLWQYATGCLLTCVNDFKILLMRVISTTETTHGNLTGQKRLLISLMEPTIDYIMKCIFKNVSEVGAGISCGNVSLIQNSIWLGSKFHFLEKVCYKIFGIASADAFTI